MVTKLDGDFIKINTKDGTKKTAELISKFKIPNLGEYVIYKIDKMFHQILRNKALSSKVKGIIFGDFTGSGKYLDEIQFEFASFLNVPYEINKNIGHIKNNLILPFGKTF